MQDGRNCTRYYSSANIKEEVEVGDDVKEILLWKVVVGGGLGGGGRVGGGSGYLSLSA